MSEKYPTCVHISVLVLFFVIRTVAPFEVIPIWLNHTLPAVLPHLKADLERRFLNGLQLARRITLNRLDVVEPLSFEHHFQFWEHPKVAGRYGGTVRRLAKLHNLVFRQKLLHKVRWMRWRVIMVEKRSTLDQKRSCFLPMESRNLFENFLVDEQSIDDHLQTQVAHARCFPMLLSEKVGQNEDHCQQICDHF